ARDQRLTRLRDDLWDHVVRQRAAGERPADEIEIGLRCAGEAELDLLETDPHEQLEQRALALVPHRVGKRLVAVAQVDRAPRRGGGQRTVGPLPVGQVNAGRSLVTAVIEGHRGPRSERAEEVGCTASSSPAGGGRGLRETLGSLRFAAFHTSPALLRSSPRRSERQNEADTLAGSFNDRGGAVNFVSVSRAPVMARRSSAHSAVQMTPPVRVQYGTAAPGGQG